MSSVHLTYSPAFVKFLWYLTINHLQQVIKMDSFKNLTILLSCCELKYTRKTHCTRWANIKKTGNHLDVCCYLKKATGQIANTHIQISVDVDEQYIWT